MSIGLKRLLSFSKRAEFKNLSTFMDEEVKQLKVGMKISCFIQGYIISQGVVTKNVTGQLYICQDIIQGSETSEKGGYTKSWCVGEGLSSSLQHTSVTGIRVKKDVSLVCILCGEKIKILGLCSKCIRKHFTYTCKCGRLRCVQKRDNVTGLCGVCISKLPLCRICGKRSRKNLKFNTGEPACPKCKDKEYILKYGYFNTFAKMKYEKDIKDYIGFELELECKKDIRVTRLSNWRKNRTIVGFISRLIESIGLKFHLYCSTDGSLIDGIEFQAIPCTYNYIIKKFRLKRLFSHLFKYFYSNKNCGLHFHMSRETISDLEIVKMMYFLNENNDWAWNLSRREKMDYCQSIPVSCIHLKPLAFPKSKTYVLFPSKKTVELRLFQAPTNFTQFMEALQFTELLRIYVKKYSLASCKKHELKTFKEEAKKMGFDYLYKAL